MYVCILYIYIYVYIYIKYKYAFACGTLNGRYAARSAVFVADNLRSSTFGSSLPAAAPAQCSCALLRLIRRPSAVLPAAAPAQCLGSS